jgi:hypothetical protein
VTDHRSWCRCGAKGLAPSRLENLAEDTCGPTERALRDARRRGQFAERNPTPDRAATYAQAMGKVGWGQGGGRAVVGPVVRAHGV